MNTARQTPLILALAALLCAGWTLAARMLPRPELAETNYEANRLRIERWLLDPPASNVVVGTSISGRLLPGYFAGTSLASMANLGLDGGNPGTGLALVLARPTPPAIVFLEVHRLTVPPGTNDQQLLDLIRGPGLQASRFLPLTRADRRPSTVLYGWLKSRQSGGGPVTAGQARSALGIGVNKPDPEWYGRIQRLVAAVQSRGTRVVLLRLPVGRENPVEAESASFADEARDRLGLPLLDLFRLTLGTADAVTYTDGLHLSPESAATLAQRLASVAEGDFLPKAP